MTPDYIRGVINLRGNVVPVIDLSAILVSAAAVCWLRLIQVKKITV